MSAPTVAQIGLAAQALWDAFNYALPTDPREVARVALEAVMKEGEPMIENVTREEWVKYGQQQAWIGEQFCATHENPVWPEFNDGVEDCCNAFQILP